MKAKVTGSRGPECWYGKHQGKVFDVWPYIHLGMSTGDFEAKDPDYDGVAIIAREDCELVVEKCPHCGKDLPPEFQKDVV